MDVSVSTWSTLSKLLDEAFDLEPAARAAWLEQLSLTQPGLAPAMQRLLAAHASSETADVLGRLPAMPAPGPCTAAFQPGDHIGPYRLKREIGTGGMADVWLAERADSAFTRELALKLPLINRLRRDLAQRFARERDILARLEHPNIARFYDAGVHDDLPYLAMEYVDGQPITVYCDAHRFGVRQRLQLFAQVLTAVQYAHANLVIHRDLKPSNILVTADGQVRLLDFGIAKLLADADAAPETQLTQLAGRALTPEYASPEQIKGEPLTIATDIYSLGVLLCELLAGHRPYRLQLASVAQLEQAIVALDPGRPSGLVSAEAALARDTSARTLARTLIGDLDTIVLKALAKLPADRYSTIAEFGDDLHRFLSGQPVHARPASWTYRARKFVIRNRLVVGAGTAISVALIAAAVVSIWQARIARQQTAVAQQQTTVAQLVAKRAQAVQEFLVELFAASGSQQRSAQERRNMTAVQLLDRGADGIDKLQTSAPEAHAYLLKLFGEIYEDLGLNERSLQLHQQSVNASRLVYGRDAHTTVMAEMELAWILNKLRRTDEAWSLIAHVQAVLSVSAPRSMDYAQALYFESQIFKHGDPSRSLRTAEAAVKLIEELGASEYRATMARWAYATGLHLAGNNERALIEFRKTAEELEALFGPDYGHLATLNDELAGVLRTLKRLDEARAALQRALSILEKNPRPTIKANTLIRLSSLLQATGDASGAREQLDLALQERLRSSEAGSPSVEEVRGFRAMLLVTQGDIAEGITELLHLQKVTPEASHLAHLAYCDTLARAYLSLNKPSSAREQVQRGKSILEKKGAIKNRAFALAGAAAELAAYEGNANEAEREVETARKILNVSSSESTDAANLLLLEARVAESLGQTQTVRAITAPFVEKLLNAPPNYLDLKSRGELALIAARARSDTDLELARRLAVVANDLLQRTQVRTSPLLRQAEAVRASLST